MKRIAVLFSVAIILVMLAAPVSAAPVQHYPPYDIPLIYIISVETDAKVTISTANFPASKTFDVRMGKYGTLGIDGTKVTQVDSGSGGKLSFTFDIPAALKGQKRIAIRLESTTGGYYSYNWFWNDTSVPSTPTTPSTPSTPAVIEVVPTFSISAVVKDDKVTIKTASLSAGQTYDVYINAYGTMGIGGTKVDSISSGSGGTQSITVSIPAAFHGDDRIAIRLQNPSTGYYGYNWFWNNTYP